MREALLAADGDELILADRLGRRGDHVIEILKAQSGHLRQDSGTLRLREQPGER